LLWAQSFAGSGVGAAAASLGGADAPVDAGADAAWDWPAVDGAVDAPGLQAVNIMIAATARTGNLSWLLILWLLHSRWP
jgi:hypothetical protein